MKNSLAFDFGATSIRALLGYVKDGKFETKEVMRMSHSRVDEDGRSRWQFEELLKQVVQTILEYKDCIDSIAINTWGVDFGIVGKDGQLLEHPISYRDAKHVEGFEIAKEVYSLKEIFMQTGNQIMPINTLFQLLVLKKESVNFNKIEHILMLPDLFNYYLTGNVYTEMTIASTSQLFDLATQQFSDSILNGYGLSKDMFGKVIEPGFVVGSTKNSLLTELRNTDIKVVASASHDTASAVLMTQAYTDKYTAFLSCGTWSLIGAITDKAIISEQAYASSLTNEAGFNKTNMFFKNITGLYIIEMLKSQLERKYGRCISFDEINNYVKDSNVSDVVDVENECFAQNSFDVVACVDELLNKHQAHDFDYFKIIYLSLAYKYKETLESIEQIVGYKFNKIHMIGGGVKSKLLCSLICSIVKKDLICGPMEATAYGNLLVQKCATGEFKSIKEGRELILNSSTMEYISSN